MKAALLSALLAGAVIAAPAAAQSLDAVVEASLAHSPALRAARARADSAAAKVGEARAQRAPTLSVDGSIGTGRIDPRGFFGLVSDNVTPRSARATVELPLFTGGRVDAAVRQAKDGREAARQEAREDALALRVQVVRAYTDAIAANELIARYRTLLAVLDETVRQAGLKFRAGNGTSTDLAQAQARRAEAQAGLAGAQGQLAIAEVQLQSLAGAHVTVSAALPPPPMTPPTAEDAASRALVDNPAVLAADRLAAAARAGVDAAHAERLPAIGAFAEAATVRDQFFPGYKADSDTIGVRAHWTLFSGGRTAAKERGAEADLTAAEADATAVRLQVHEQAISGFNAVMTARAMLEAATARAVATERALHDTRLEVQTGAKPQLALLDAEREAIEGESARIAAEGDLLVAAYRLRAIAGMD